MCDLLRLDPRVSRTSIARCAGYMPGAAVPPLLVHSSADAVSTKPWPLQLFWPLHAFFSDLQLAWPLHELMPMQWTAAVFSGAAGDIGLVSEALLPHAATNRLPAANAIMVPVRTGFFMGPLL